MTMAICEWKSSNFSPSPLNLCSTFSRYQLWGGFFLISFALFMLSLAKEGQFYQVRTRPTTYTAFSPDLTPPPRSSSPKASPSASA